MKKIILVFTFLLITQLAHAGMFVCFDVDDNYKGKREGDCFTLGICSGYNNTGLNPQCIIATKEEYDLAGKFTERVGGTVVPMQQAEIDAILQAEADAQIQAEIDRADRLDFTIEDVIIALVKRINTRIPSNPITKQEVVDQLKADKGL